MQRLKGRGGYTRIHIEGTMGYGKLHILAVLAGLLSHSGKWMVHLPDCRELLINTVQYLQSALLCAFADPLSFNKCERIRALQLQDDLERFCRANSPLYFIIDQMNAMDHEGPNMDIVSNGTKMAIRQYLASLTSGHY